MDLLVMYGLCGKNNLKFGRTMEKSNHAYRVKIRLKEILRVSELEEVHKRHLEKIKL